MTDRTIAQRFADHGFGVEYAEIEGERLPDCLKRTSADGEIVETIHILDAARLEGVDPATLGKVAEVRCWSVLDTPDGNASPTTGYTLGDCLAALDHPSNEYGLLELRLDADFHRATDAEKAAVLKERLANHGFFADPLGETTCVAYVRRSGEVAEAIHLVGADALPVDASGEFYGANASDRVMIYTWNEAEDPDAEEAGLTEGDIMLRDCLDALDEFPDEFFVADCLRRSNFKRT